MTLHRMPATSPAVPIANPQSAGVEDGDRSARMEPTAELKCGIAVLDPRFDPWLYQDRRWCANCGGEQTFIPVDRFAFGWRGYCHGCEEVVYVMETRANSEVA